MSPSKQWWSPWREAGDWRILHVDLSADSEHERLARALLDQDELERFNRFVPKDARRRYALCRAALRINLCQWLGCANRDLSFGYGEHGKPFARVGGVPSDASFNVSHSGRHGLIGFTTGKGLGVDLEVRAGGRDFDGIGRRVYSLRERRALSAVRGHARVDLFYRFWSLKEALIKALGTGFTLGPSHFELSRPIIEGERSGVIRFPHLPSNPFWVEDLGEERFAAACAFPLTGEEATAGRGIQRR